MTDPTTETWTYCGRRATANGVLGQEFLDPSGEPVLFKKLMRGGVIGGTYEVKVLRDTDTLRVAGTPSYQGRSEHEDADTWAARDRAASVADTVRKREAADEKASRDLGGLTLDELSHMYVRLPAPQAMALEVQVMARLRQVRAR